LEFSGFDGLSANDRHLLTKLVSRITVVDVTYSNSELMQDVIALRQTRALKLPDAIVMASAAINQAAVLTNDIQLLKVGKIDSKYRAQGFSEVKN